ncbi:zinc knuckle CX2CX4HX4C containing protein [Tanacetum coccineum]
MNVCDLEEEKRERSLDNNSYVSDQDVCFRKKGRREKTRSDRIFGKRKSDFEMGGPVFIGDKKVAVAGGGLEDVLENWPWMIYNNPIILKKWSMSTCLCMEELTRIPVWVKIHDVPIQVFSEDGLSIIASQIGKPVKLDSYTSSMCIESWGRSSFTCCLIEINAEDVLKENLTIGVPLI